MMCSLVVGSLFEIDKDQTDLSHQSEETKQKKAEKSRKWSLTAERIASQWNCIEYRNPIVLNSSCATQIDVNDFLLTDTLQVLSHLFYQFWSPK